MVDFKDLYAVNVNENVEKKNGLTYLSWAWAWAEFMKRYPQAEYEIVKFNGLPYAYDPNTGYMVYTKVTVDGQTREMWLPVMDSANKAMKSEPYKYTDRYGKEHTVASATMFDINKTIMRCLVKNLAMFGLGLYIYAGEDLPEEVQEKKPIPMASKQACDYIRENTTAEQLEKLMMHKNVHALEELTEEQAMNICIKLNKRIMEGAEKHE